MIMIALFEAYLWSQVVLPFNSVDVHVLFMSSSLVHLPLHAVADVPGDADEQSQEAERNHDVGRDDLPSVPVLCLYGDQVDPGAGQHKSHARQDHTAQGPQLLLHSHDHLTHLLLLYWSFQVPFSSFSCRLMERSIFTSLDDAGIRQEVFVVLDLFSTCSAAILDLPKHK